MSEPREPRRHRRSAVAFARVAFGVWLALTASPGALTDQGAPADRVHWLVVVDDLHLDFRGTGRLRDLLRATADAVVQDDDLVSAMSTGPSGVMFRDSAGPRAFKDSVKRITGNGLKDDDVVDGTRQSRQEVAYRTRTALVAATAFVEAHHTSPSSRTRVLLVISRGWAIEPSGDPAVTGASAFDSLDMTIAALGAVAISVTPPDLSSPLPARAAARRHAEAKAASLQRLVQPSGGFAAIDAVEGRAAIMSKMRAAAGR
jgi:hypothetical protein